jgi:putrescine aminotransferase
MSPPGYLERVRAICDKYDLLFIADEVVTGFGRTGAWFGVNHSGVTPDIMTFAKGLSSGYLPLGAAIIHRRISEQMLAAPDDFVFTHGYTYSGHPTCCAVGLKNLEIIEREGLVEKSRLDGAYLFERLQRLTELDIVGEVRGLGLLAAVDLTSDKATRERFSPQHEVGKRIGEKLFELGAITRVGHDIITMRPPLIISRGEIDELVDAIEQAIRSVQAQL